MKKLSNVKSVSKATTITPDTNSVIQYSAQLAIRHNRQTDMERWLHPTYKPRFFANEFFPTTNTDIDCIAEFPDHSI